MKRPLLTAVCAVLSISAWGQSAIISDVIAILGEGRTVSCSYSYSLRGDFPMKGSGTAVLCGDMFHLKENGTDNYSDGVTTWTVDNASREVVVSSSGPSILERIKSYAGQVRDFRFDGSTLHCSAVSESEGLDFDFQASGIKVEETTPSADAFRFDVSSLDKSWIITDLR